MRFHIGVSKRIKLSTLLKILGFLLVGLLGYIGLIDHAFASTSHTLKFCSYLTDTHIHYVSFEYNNQYNMSNDYTWTSTLKERCSNNSYSNGTLFNRSSYNFVVGAWKNSNTTTHRVFTKTYVDINNKFCDISSEVDTINSIDMWFTLKDTSVDYINNSILIPSPINGHFGTLQDYNDAIEFAIEPIYSTDLDPRPSYACIINSNSSADTTFTVACNSIPWDENIVGYSFVLYNKYYYNFENKKDVFYVQNTGDMGFPFNGTFEKNVDYQCSYVEPTEPNEAIGESNIDFDSISSDGSSASVIFPDNNLYLDWYDELDVNQSLQNLILLPYRFVDLLANGQLGTCTPISINFSSLTRRFGGGDYYLQVPCMRTVMTRYLGVNIVGNFSLYGLADLFTATFLLIWFAQKFWFAIQDMLSGHDIKDYLRIG